MSSVAVLTYMECFSDAPLNSYAQSIASQSSPIWNASLTNYSNHKTAHFIVAVLTYMECFSDFKTMEHLKRPNVAVLTYMECFSDKVSFIPHDATERRSPHLYGMLLWHAKTSTTVDSGKVAVLTYMECFSDNKKNILLWMKRLSQSSPIWNASLTFFRFDGNAGLVRRSPHLYGMLLWLPKPPCPVRGTPSQSSPIWNASLTKPTWNNRRINWSRSPHLYGMLLWQSK